MRNAIKRQWQALKAGSPGHRFKDRYAAGQKERQSGGAKQHFARLFKLLLALVALVVGVILVFIPGPAVVFFFLAGSLLASEFLVVARALDWTELKLRAAWHWGRRHWKKLPSWGRVAVTGLAVSLGVAGAYGAYRVMAG